MHFPTKNRRRRKSLKFNSAALRNRRNAVIELCDDRERHLELLFMAICSGDTDEMGQILRSRSSSTYCDASSDLLNCACATGNASSVQMLLQNGIPFRSVGGKGDAPLHTAVRRGSLDIAKILLDYGADINVETRSERRTPLHLASASRKLDVQKYLLEKEAEVDKVDIYGSTALHLAAETGFSNGVSALLESHADPDIFNRDGWTALHLAAANGHLSVVEQLIEAHATVDCQNRFGRTPLHWACDRGHLQVARLLLKHNASIEVRDKNDRTAFDHAATREIRNLIDATSSVTNLSVIPRISSSIHYVVGESTLRLTRASAFVDALERARWSSYTSSDSGIDCPGASSPLRDNVFDERRWSYDGEAGQRGRQRRQRKKPIWSKPDNWRPLSAPVVPTAGNDLFQLPLKNGTDGKQSISAASRSTSTFCDSFSSNELNSLWPQADTTQRSHSVHSDPYYLEKARQLGRFLSPILEDDKTSVGTSILGGGEDDPTNYGEERTRPSSDPKTRWRPRSRASTSMLADSSEEDSTKGSRKERNSESEADDAKDVSRTSEYCSLTRDLEKILKRVSLASEKEETVDREGTGLHSSQTLIGALNSGLRQLLSHLDTNREEEEEEGDDLFSEA